MNKLISKALMLILFVLCTFIYIGCTPEEKVIEKANSKVELVDLAKTYDGEITDIDGNLIVPFDVAYSEEFNTGNYKYNEDNVLIKVKKSFNNKYLNNPEKYDEEFELCGIKSIEKMYDVENGTWYKANLKKNTDPLLTIKYLRSLSYIMVAELDYIYDVESVDGAEVLSETGNADISWANGKVHKNKLLKEQDYLKESDLQKAWKFLEDNGMEPGGLSSTVVAVIDTGVDYTHPDLKDNMWVNVNEISGNGIDDDNNGYIDDVHGANVIANNGNADMKNTGNPMDDHGHGTHVAGIIGATNNEEGVVGIAYNAKIMAVKAGQASGYFNQSDIAEAILYAYSMGAEVINMSFGGSACTMAVQDALQTAYTSSVLIASAGNDTAANEPCSGWNGNVIPNYPAALSYVVGVMSVGLNGLESSFTNFDSSGYNSIEYEVYAPGEDIMSTLPNGKYGKLSGTSMASPVVAGTAALLRSYYKDRNMYPSKFIMAQLCATSEDRPMCIHKDVLHNIPMIINIYDALTKLPKPDINLYDRYIFDYENTSDSNNGDGVIDAGETLEIGMILKNRWGMSKDTIVTITDTNDLGGDDPYVEIINGTVNFDGVGTYQTKDNLVQNDNYKYIDVENPIIVKISKNCPNDYIVKLTVKIEYKNGLDEDDNTLYSNALEYATIEFGVRNGVVLTGQIKEDMTLTSDNYYIIPSSLYINEGVTLTVEEGTNIQFWSSNAEDIYAETGIAEILVAGDLIINGTYKNPVNIFPSEFMDRYRIKIDKEYTGYIELNYTNIKNPYISVDKANYCKFSNVYAEGLFYKQINSESSTRICDMKIVLSDAYKCAFTNIVSLDNNYNLTLSGKFECCMFYKCGINYNTLVTNSGNYDLIYFDSCIFEETSVYNDSFESHQIEKYTKLKIFHSELNNHTYIAYDFSDQHGIQALTLIAYQKFIESLGGNLACFETNEEFLDLYNNFRFYSNYFIGIKNVHEWNNGSLIEDFVKFKMNSYDCGFYRVISDHTKYIEVERCTYALNVIFEFDEMYDNDGNLIIWTEEKIEEEFEKYYNEGKFSYFTNNVIINNYNDLSKSKLFVITSNKNNNDHFYDEVFLFNNYWLTDDIDLINSQITDFDDYSSLADINNDHYSIIAPENTFPFVDKAYVLDSNGEKVSKVGNEEVTFVVKFNRDMDTSIPLRFRFGSYDPYADYEVEGEYVNPREWRGTYYLNTTIENGNMYYNIENGKAADDNLDFIGSKGMFKFEIDTTLAQAMIMQAEATDTGINLTWMQDDFDTLLGYNIYRSTEEDGLYTRLNDYVLSYDENTFFDATVEPGVMYYYNFTVVKTDLTESTPSGKIVIRSKDTMAPNIYHTPIALAYTNNNILVNATVIDNLIIESVKLYYKSSNSSEWKSVVMNAVNNKYMGLITSDNITINGLDYYIEAYDGISYTYNGSKEDPYKIQIKEELSKSSYGDVDGDGSITVKDAQMLLMAINDLLNLKADEFARADIDRNGKLEAFEALRILDYISGKINYIV